MVRLFVDLDGYVMAEDEWRLRPVDKCFYCNKPLILVQDSPCGVGFEGIHQFVTLCARQFT